MGDLLVITGLSGAGRSEFARHLEDLGWFVIDRLPPDIMIKVADLAHGPESRWDRVAFVVRADTSEGETLRSVDRLRRMVDRLRLVFLDCSTEALVRRYKDSRRPHPHPGASGIAEGIEAERELMAPLRSEADLVVDTSELNVHGLRDLVAQLYGEAGDRPLRTSVTSFGFKHGVPRDADVVFDCRFLPNPYWVEGLRSLSGLDAEVRDYVLGQDLATGFLDRIDELLGMLLPGYEVEGKSYLSLGLGCTGGRHRSVAMVEALAERLRARGLDPAVIHRDLDR
ncbi:MAG: RNase adapter RapZ [Acidimicrobiales bacterium]|nr:RNase adapter RapZ [Acidimicrobiales bacterium]